MKLVIYIAVMSSGDEGLPRDILKVNFIADNLPRTGINVMILILAVFQ